MADRRAFILTSKERRKYVATLVASLEKFSRVEIKGPQRTLDQNSALWPTLTEVSEQHQHHGVTLTPEDWRLVFLDMFWRLKKAEFRMVPNLSGDGFVQLSGRSTSDLSVPEMSEYIELIKATASEEWGVVFHDGDQGGGTANNRPAEVSA